MKSKFHNEAVALSKQPWKNLVLKLRNITFEYGFDIETRLFEETKKIESKIRFVKQLIIEYTHQTTIKDFQKTMLYQNMQNLLIELEKNYLLHVKQILFLKRNEKLKIFPILNAMMMKTERGNGKGYNLNGFANAKSKILAGKTAKRQRKKTKKKIPAKKAKPKIKKQVKRRKMLAVVAASKRRK